MNGIDFKLEFWNCFFFSFLPAYNKFMCGAIWSRIVVFIFVLLLIKIIMITLRLHAIRYLICSLYGIHELISKTVNASDAFCWKFCNVKIRKNGSTVSPVCHNYYFHWFEVKKEKQQHVTNSSKIDPKSTKC